LNDRRSVGGKRRLELGLDHRLDELAHPIAQTCFDRIKPIVEKMDRRLRLLMQNRRLRGIVDHGLVCTNAGSFGFQHPETTPPSIPTKPRTASSDVRKNLNHLSVSPSQGGLCENS
jgi:hypothetical protein